MSDTATLTPTIEDVLSRVKEDGAAKKAITEPDFLQKILDDVAAITTQAPTSTATEKERKAIVSIAAKITTIKTAIDGAGKDANAGLREQINATDAIRRKVRDTLDSQKAKVRKPVDEWEQAEAARKEEFDSLMAQITNSAVVTLGMTAAQITARRDEISRLTISDNQFTPPEVEKLEQARLATLQGLARDLEIAERSEAQAAEIARLKKAEATRLAEEAERKRKDADDAARAAQAAKDGGEEAKAETPDPISEPAASEAQQDPVKAISAGLLAAADEAGLPLAPGVAMALAEAIKAGRVANVKWEG